MKLTPVWRGELTRDSENQNPCTDAVQRSKIHHSGDKRKTVARLELGNMKLHH